MGSLMFSAGDKMILHKFEGAAEPARVFSKFTQDNRNLFSSTLFQARITVQDTTANNFSIIPDTSQAWIGLLIYVSTGTGRLMVVKGQPERKYGY